MTDRAPDVDPWQRRHADPTAGGPEYARLVEAVRRLQDAVVQIAAPEEQTSRAADAIDDVAAELEKWPASEWERSAGRRSDLPGRGHPLLLPVLVDEQAGTTLRGRVTFGPYYLGGNGAAHGGALPLLFDEVLGMLVNSVESGAPRRTAYLTVNYRAITPVGTELRLTASVDRTEGRKTWATGRLHDGDQLVADAEGLFVKLRPGQP
jgi:acyl-coenzyme A thioesterase PaaI-like protein